MISEITLARFDMFKGPSQTIIRQRCLGTILDEEIDIDLERFIETIEGSISKSAVIYMLDESPVHWNTFIKDHSLEIIIDNDNNKVYLTALSESKLVSDYYFYLAGQTFVGIHTRNPTLVRFIMLGYDYD